MAEFQRLRVQPVAISVDEPATSLELSRKAGYSFPLLSDPEARVIREFDLVHEGAGIDGHDVARPAEFLLDRTGTVVWRNLTEDYRVRARADAMLERARSMPRREGR